MALWPTSIRIEPILRPQWDQVMVDDCHSDPQAKLVLNEAIEQVTVMARLHRLLHADNEVPTIDSERFIAELCQDLETSMACARPISIQCVAVSRQLPVGDKYAKFRAYVVDGLPQ